ncbi:MAG TPA: HEAT repeat domain-containing protein [Dissulfurispiraceae bacterium]|nr:HEAT repeat domain-containing protein [Dissulfurispiraceae bacterium]
MEDDQINKVQNFFKAVLKAKKMLQIYPSNNVIYLSALNEAYTIAAEYLERYGNLTCRVRPSEIQFESEPVYQSSGKTDNLALFFFKEGISDLTLIEGLTKNEFEELLRLLGMDYEKDDTVGDFLSAVWELGFEHIKFTIDELVFSEDGAGAGYGLPGGGVSSLHPSSMGGAGDGSPGGGVSSLHSSSMEGNYGESGTLFLSGMQDDGNLMTEGGIAGEGTAPGARQDGDVTRAYNDALVSDEIVMPSVGELTSEERSLIIAEMDRDPAEKSDQIITILLTLLLESHGSAEAEKIAKSIEEVILFSLKRNQLSPALIILRWIQQTKLDRQDRAEIREQLDHMLSFCRSSKVMEILGRMLDTSRDINEEHVQEFANCLGGESADAFIALLEHLQSIHARRIVNNILIMLGKENLKALSDRLKDPTWYVVRNMVYVLRNIGNSALLEDILSVARHEHPRVRLEVVKALNDFKSVRALEALKDYFDDIDATVRLSAIAVIGNMAKDNSGARLYARDVLIAKIREKRFEERDFREKKLFYETLAMFHDKDADAFMMETLKKKSLFGGKKLSESKACAAHYLGLAGSKAASPLLQKLSRSSDQLLKEHAIAALQRLKDE